MFARSTIYSSPHAEVRECPPTTSALQIAEATGGPWGATYVDRQFIAFCKELVGDKWKYVDNAMQLQLLTSWETAKLEVGSDAPEGVAIPLTELIDQIAGMEALAQ
jgi:hypothetical protein